MSSLRLDQTLKTVIRLSPAQLMLMKLLEYPTVDLEQRINEELQANPLLEEGVAKDANDNDEERDNPYEDENENYTDNEEEYRNPLDGDDYRDFSEEPNGDERTDDWRENNYTGGQSLHESLKAQIYLTKMDKPMRHIAKWVIGNVDEDGFLRRSVTQLIDEYAFQEGEIVPDEKMEEIVDQIKHFDPAGVGARDLQECLLLQLKRKGFEQNVSNAIRVINLAWDDFCNRHFNRIRERLDMSEAELSGALEVIRHLNQKPANAFDGNTNEDRHRQTIIPDFIVENNDGELVMTLCSSNLPPLHVSEEYQAMEEDLRTKKRTKENRETLSFLREKMESARDFISALEQRNHTLYAIMSAILRMQRSFFLTGDDTNLRPMRLHHVSEQTGYDVSTISRACNSKWVQTEFGVYPLQHFFSEKLENSEGNEVSTREIKKILRQAIDNEDKRNPLPDEQLVVVLAEQGYKIARRTVAKYREELNIPVARLRKDI